MLNVDLVWGTALLYIALLFLVAYYADQRQKQGRSITTNPAAYALSIAVYATSWTYYGSVGKAATTGIDFLPIYLGPTLTAFSWWFLLKKIVRISKQNNITSIADFISSRYGRSQWLGAIITVITLMGIMPYIALQLRAVATSFTIITGYHDFHLGIMERFSPFAPHPGLFSALLLGLFSVLFGARHLSSAERHEGLVAVIALESVVKLVALLTVGVFLTYGVFDGQRLEICWLRDPIDLFFIQIQGSGRVRLEDKIDPSVGLSAIAPIGAKVGKDRPLALVHAAREDAANRAIAQIQAACIIADKPPHQEKVIHALVGA